jgi:hypothetical protein
MASESAQSENSLPVSAPEKNESGPPTLAEPASGPAAAVPDAGANASGEDKTTSDG